MKGNTKMIIRVSQPRKMGAEELQSHLSAKRQGNGAHRSSKDYNRKALKKVAY